MINTSIFERLKEERKRLKLTQATVAELTGVKRETWSRYESGAVSPGMEVLAALAAAGANIQYILTGEKSGGVTLSRDEVDLVQCYRAAPLAVKAAALAALTAGSAPSSGTSQVFSGNISGQFAGRDINNIGKKK